MIRSYGDCVGYGRPFQLCTPLNQYWKILVFAASLHIDTIDFQWFCVILSRTLNSMRCACLFLSPFYSVCQCCNSIYLLNCRGRRCRLAALFFLLVYFIHGFNPIIWTLCCRFNCCASYLKPKQKINHQYVIFVACFFPSFGDCCCYCCCCDCYHCALLFFLSVCYFVLVDSLLRRRLQNCVFISIFFSFNSRPSNSRSRQFCVSLRLTITSIAIGIVGNNKKKPNTINHVVIQWTITALNMNTYKYLSNDSIFFSFHSFVFFLCEPILVLFIYLIWSF